MGTSTTPAWRSMHVTFTCGQHSHEKQAGAAGISRQCRRSPPQTWPPRRARSSCRSARVHLHESDAVACLRILLRMALHAHARTPHIHAQHHVGTNMLHIHALMPGMERNRGDVTRFLSRMPLYPELGICTHLLGQLLLHTLVR